MPLLHVVTIARPTHREQFAVAAPTELLDALNAAVRTNRLEPRVPTGIKHPFPLVKSHVFTVRLEDDQHAGPVVIPRPDVMYDSIKWQGATKGFLGHEDVLVDVSSMPSGMTGRPRSDIALRVDRSTTLPVRAVVRRHPLNLPKPLYRHVHHS